MLLPIYFVSFFEKKNEKKIDKLGKLDNKKGLNSMKLLADMIYYANKILYCSFEF